MKIEAIRRKLELYKGKILEQFEENTEAVQRKHWNYKNKTLYLCKKRKNGAVYRKCLSSTNKTRLLYKERKHFIHIKKSWGLYKEIRHWDSTKKTLELYEKN